MIIFSLSLLLKRHRIWILLSSLWGQVLSRENSVKIKLIWPSCLKYICISDGITLAAHDATRMKYVYGHTIMFDYTFFLLSSSFLDCLPSSYSNTRNDSPPRWEGQFYQIWNRQFINMMKQNILKCYNNWKKELKQQV